jgi:hypothetical protein
MDLPDGKCLTRPSSRPNPSGRGKKQKEPGMLVETHAEASFESLLGTPLLQRINHPWSSHGSKEKTV